MQTKKGREGVALRARNKPELRWEARAGQNYATTEAAIWKRGEAAMATMARAARTKVAERRIEGRVVVIGVSPGARVSMNPMYQDPVG